MKNLNQLLAILIIYFLISNIFLLGTFFNIILTYLTYKLAKRVFKTYKKVIRFKNKTVRYFR